MSAHDDKEIEFIVSYTKHFLQKELDGIRDIVGPTTVLVSISYEARYLAWCIYVTAVRQGNSNNFKWSQLADSLSIYKPSHIVQDVKESFASHILKEKGNA